MPIKRGFASVAFDELAWHEDLRQAAGSAKRIGEETRFRLEREGQAIDALFACDEEARDGTVLPGCVKVYLPPPGGPLALSSDSRKEKTDGSISTIWHSAFGICRRARVGRPSISSRTDG
ncbi:MAG TPA: hypothetical protein VHP56_09015 [Solirubrobacterales bacterium]|nr:hypothetical protein [Solirubrobacterales bacterium]